MTAIDGHSNFNLNTCDLWIPIVYTFHVHIESRVPTLSVERSQYPYQGEQL